MDPSIRSAYEMERGVPQKPFAAACYAPFTSLYLNTNGDVIACCKNTSYVLGNVAQSSLLDIWRGKRVNALRKALGDYKFGLGCEFCEWQIQSREFGQVYTRTFDDLPLSGQDPQWPSMLEFALSNTCNLACVMCYGELSSTIRSQREGLPPLPKTYDDRFFADLAAFLPHLHRAKFFGGEPFLASESYRVWDLMIEAGLSTPCHVTTNGTQWNSKVERVLAALPISLSISVDGATKATAESIRINMDFDVVTANVERFLAYTRRRGTYFSLTYCLMRQNWHEFGAYLQYAERLGVEVFVNTVIDPVSCSLYTLPPAELAAIVARLEAEDSRQHCSQLPRNGGVWRTALETLRKSANARQQEGVQEVKDAHRVRAEQQRPDHVTAAWRLVGEGKLDAAVVEARLVAAGSAHYYQALQVEAHALRRLRRFGEAEAALARAIATWRKAPYAFVERGWLRLDQDQLADAAADAAEAIRLLQMGEDSKAAAAVYHLASTVATRSGDLVMALAHADALVDSAPRPEFFLHRADVHERRRDFAAMRADAATALRLAPDHAEAEAVLARATAAGG